MSSPTFICFSLLLAYIDQLTSDALLIDHLNYVVKECDQKKEIILMVDFNINCENKTHRRTNQSNTYIPDSNVDGVY
jgi:hypothetical protein